MMSNIKLLNARQSAAVLAIKTSIMTHLSGYPFKIAVGVP